MNEGALPLIIMLSQHNAHNPSPYKQQFLFLNLYLSKNNNGEGKQTTTKHKLLKLI